VITEWKYYCEDSGFVSNEIFCAFQDKAGNMWFGTSNGLVKRSADGGTWTTYDTTNSEIAGNVVENIIQDKEGNLWFGTLWSGVSELTTTGNWINYDIRSYSNQLVNCIMEDSSGNMWFGGQDDGWIKKMNSSGGWTTYTNSNNDTALTILPISSIITFMQDKDSNIWCASLGYGVSRLTTQKECTVYTNDVTNNIDGLMQDRKGNMWIKMRYNGVSVFNGTAWTTYNTANTPLADDHIGCMAEDSLGNMWFGSGNYQGVSKMFSDKSTWTTYTHFGEYDPDTKSYTNDDEAPYGIFGAISCIAQDRDGNMWIGSNYGLSEAICKPIDVNVDTVGIDTSAGSTSSITVKSDVSWTATTDVDWLTLSPSVGSIGNYDVTLIIDKNIYAEHSAHNNKHTSSMVADVFITGSTGTVDTIPVQIMSFKVSMDSITLSADKGQYSLITVNTNTVWKISYKQDPAWLLLISDSGFTNEEDTLTFSGCDTFYAWAAVKNMTAKPRTDTLVLSAGNLVKKVIVGQKALVSVSKDSISFDSTVNSLGSFKMSFGSDSLTNWTILVDSSWLSVDKTSGSASTASGDLEFTVNALSKNSGDSSRIAHIFISAKGINDTISAFDTINVTQKGVLTTFAGEKRSNFSSNAFALERCLENPHNGNASVTFSLAKDGYTTLKLYDIMGREIAVLVNGMMSTGRIHTVTFDASRFSTSTILARLESSGKVQIKKIRIAR
jgi:hypothetical protein